MKASTLTEGLAALERLGIRKRADVSIDDLLYTTGGTEDDETDYLDLLCLLGGEVERGDFQIISDDLWHFDTECIVGDGDYVEIAERLVALSKGELAISNLSDHVGESSGWLEFDFQGQRVHWDLKVNDDWVDWTVFNRFAQLFTPGTSGARFTYAGLGGGQDCFLGFATDGQRLALNNLSELKFEWLW
jgi:hypothetical protein